VARASAFQAEGRGFESRFPLHFVWNGAVCPQGCVTDSSVDSDRWRGEAALAKREPAHVAQSVEHILGKDEVTSSILVVGSIDVRWFYHAKYHYLGLHGLQTAELYDDQEQKDHAESAGNEKVL
jgi:hypothetical protein